MNNEEMKRSLRELCRIESVAGIDVSDDAPYGAGCALADIESGKLTMNVGTIGVTDVSLVMEIDVRAPVTFEADAVTEPLRRAAAEYGIEVTLTQDTPPVYMDIWTKTVPLSGSFLRSTARRPATAPSRR